MLCKSLLKVWRERWWWWWWWWVWVQVVGRTKHDEKAHKESDVEVDGVAGSVLYRTVPYRSQEIELEAVDYLWDAPGAFSALLARAQGCGCVQVVTSYPSRLHFLFPPVVFSPFPHTRHLILAFPHALAHSHSHSRSRKSDGVHVSGGASPISTNLVLAFGVASDFHPYSVVHVKGEAKTC